MISPSRTTGLPCLTAPRRIERHQLEAGAVHRLGCSLRLGSFFVLNGRTLGRGFGRLVCCFGRVVLFLLVWGVDFVLFSFS